jgi:transposase
LLYWESCSRQEQIPYTKEALNMKYKMKQKQNQRITRITEATLVVGADIAKKIHVARAVDFRGIELGKDCVFHNDSEGLTKLTAWMKELGQTHAKTEIVFGVEPTGHYWFPLAAFLGEQGIKIVVVNPHHVNKAKELEDNSPTKSDYKDAKVIADLIRNGKYSEPNLPVKEYADLRILMNLREKVSGSLTQVKGRIGNWFDRFFPEYESVFKKWDGKASLMTMREFPLPAEIIAKGDGSQAWCGNQACGETLCHSRSIDRTYRGCNGGANGTDHPTATVRPVQRAA